MPSKSRPFLCAIALGVSLAGPARAQDGPESSPPKATAAPAPLASLEAGAVGAADAVLLGVVRTVPGVGRGATTLLRVRPEKVFRGTVPENFTLFLGGPRYDARTLADVEDLLARGVEGRYLLVVSGTPHGSGYALVTLFFAEGEEGREKAASVERELAILGQADRDQAARALLVLHVEGLAARTAWSRLHAARELEVLAAARPDLFAPQVVERLEDARRKTFDAALRASLARTLAVVRGLGQGGEGVPLPERPAPSPRVPRRADPKDPEFLRARTRLSKAVACADRVALLSEVARLGGEAAVPDLLAAFAGAGEPEVRERAAVLLGDLGVRTALPALLGGWEAEQSPAVREAVVRAAGMLGGGDDVAWVLDRSADPALAKAVVFALARLRTTAALEALEGFRVRAARAVPPDEGMVRLCEYLRADGFVEAERIAGREVGPRPPTDRGAAPGPGAASEGGPR